ncbi:MAG: Holliday junction branch migration protein RuvA [Armatimonadetes bacterium]|nr:Holliday junction branch migration protein RuvA [Armatimonadota bacterium]
MIGLLRGEVVSIDGDRFILDVSGVGYELRAPSGLLGSLMVGEGRQITTRAIFNEEEGIVLYAFAEAWHRRLFDLLVSISGIGPKLALNMLSAMEPSKLAAAIADRSASQVQQCPGVGSKLAQRIVIELGDKAAELGFERKVAAVVAQTGPSELDDLVESLVKLGYTKSLARKAVETAMEENPEANENDLLRSAIRLAARG